MFEVFPVASFVPVHLLAMDTSEAHDARNTASPRPVTQTQTQTQTQEDTTTPADPPTPSTSTAPAAVGTLRLRGMGTNSTRVQWDEEVVDNEFMGRKKSKSESCSSRTSPPI
jgi:hypothetical protein